MIDFLLRTGKFLVRYLTFWHFRRLFIFLFVDVFLLALVRRRDRDVVLLIKFDLLGDYILARNFIRLMRDYEPYRGKKLALCANIMLKDFILAYDGDIFDEYVWIDRKKLLNEVWSRFEALRRLKQLGARLVFHSTRDPYMGDCLVRATCAPERIGRESPRNRHAGPRDPKTYHTTAGDFFYTRLIPDDYNPIFLFYYDRAFFSAVMPGLRMPENSRMTPIEVPIPQMEGPFAVLMPGASQAFREWPPERFAAVARHLYMNHGLRGVILGSAADQVKGAAIQQAAPEVPLENLCGQLTLPQVVCLMNRCTIGVTNDSGGIHILAALDKPGVAISNGSTFGWFHPYTREISTAVSFVYPPDFYTSPLSWDERKQTYGRPYYCSIAEVPVLPVLDRLDAVLDRRPYDDPIQKMCDAERSPALSPMSPGKTG